MPAPVNNSFSVMKLPHILLWLAASFVVLVMYYDYHSPFLQQWLATLLLTGLAALPTYFAIYLLIPRYLYRRRIGAFIISCAGCALANTAFTYGIAVFFYHLLTGKPMFPSMVFVLTISAVILFVNSAAITLGCAVHIIVSRFRMEEQLHKTEGQRTNAELDFLRAQINPHFLFNVLNTIYFQIQKENDEARASVQQLSEMLRYQLYECTGDRIDVVREVAYLHNYVAMQRLRMEAGTDIRIETDGAVSGFKIAPLLILPLVENAFKHLSHHASAPENKIHILLRTDNDSGLSVKVRNTYDARNGSVVSGDTNHGGLGIRNVQRRLELLYPDGHSLHIARQDGYFETTLNITVS